MSHSNAKALTPAMSRDVMARFYLPSLQYWSLLGSGLQPGKTVGLVGTCLPPEHRKLPASSPRTLASGRRHRATTYQALGCLQQLLAITDLRSCPWASGDRFSKAVPLVWEKQLVKEFPESELLSLLASLGFPDEKAWPKPSWTRLLFSWLSFDLDELV